ncbi:MAG: hypothetical protein F2735_00300 [Actinobacteria bacterium]|uniref:Unannotated protein n=1 Tax=freshwater metagenome TaxID=449393 RepID=A0A6J6WMB5_9ZZZZ|nr:hypothetical protein [Actinomycetota bacterium]
MFEIDSDKYDRGLKWNGKVHPLADLFPMLGPEEHAALVADIKENGLLEPGVLCEVGVGIALGEDCFTGTLLDGRNRQRACEDAGVEMRWVMCDQEDELAFVIAKNVHRRHLTPGQRAMAALMSLPQFEAEAMERMLAGVTAHPTADRPQGRKSKQRAPQARDMAAAAFKTSGKSVARAKRVMEKAPELAAKVAAGTLALEAAEQQVRAIERVAAADERSAAGPPAMDTLTKHKVIYADPPWRYEFTASDNRRIENHYPTMALEDICALQVPAADDAVLYMWATSPLLANAMKVIESWGFKYTTSMVWVKPSLGMGFYARIRHEMLLIATRGNPGTPEPSVRPDSVIEAPRGAHSVKPLLHDDIDVWWPSVTKVELFARQPVDSPWWTTWGNDQAVAA